MAKRSHRPPIAQNWPALDVRTADNGATALQILGRFTPDLILLDLMMPGMDGVTFLGKLAMVYLKREYTTSIW